MADAFEASGRSLALRLLAALKAGAEAGNDARGEFSASLRVLNYSWLFSPFTPFTTDANVTRSATWAREITWQVHAYMAMLTPADARDTVLLNAARSTEILRALKRLGYY